MDESPQTTLAETDPLAELEGMLEYRFRDRHLLVRALTHRSYVNEQEDQDQEIKHNESMEFLGDAVLGFLISARIFDRFPDSTEGELSKIKAYLVSAVNLLYLAGKIRLGDFLQISKGEEKTGGRSKRAILVDAYEALLGAIYLDGGIEAAAGFLDRQIGPLLTSFDGHRITCGDFKSALQEQLHNMGKAEPVYQVVDEIGPDHKKVFVVEIRISGRMIAQSSGRSKKEAQQAAARLALERLKAASPPENLGG